MSHLERQPEGHKLRKLPLKASFAFAALIGVSPLVLITMCSEESEEPVIRQHDTSIPRYPGFGLIDAINKSDKPLMPPIPKVSPSSNISDGEIY